MHLDDPYRALPFVLQQQARAQAGVPTPSAASLREMSGCPAMLDVAGTFASESRSSNSPLDLIELNGGKEPSGILQPLRDLARTMDDAAPLLERWGGTTGTGTGGTTTRTLAASASSPSSAAGIAAIPFSDVVQDSPIAMPGIEELAMPSPSSAGLTSSSSSEDASPSLSDFASLVGNGVGGVSGGGAGGGGTSMPNPQAAAAAAGVGGTAPAGNNAGLDFDPTTLWNSNNGLDAIEALLKIQQAALG